MYGKIQITGNIELLTGLHIGGSDAFAAIGAVDSPVIKDVKTHNPMIPGSSLKGKMRSLLAREFDEKLAGKPDDDNVRLTRLFGSSKKGQTKVSRVLFTDSFLMNAEDLRNRGADSVTEVKFENSINRLTAVANPRQIERAIRGSEFNLDLMYEVSGNMDEAEIVEDMETLAEGMKLLQYDYLGGSGSRGYGKIAFHDLSVAAVIGNLPDALVQSCNDVLTKALTAAKA